MGKSQKPVVGFLLKHHLSCAYCQKTTHFGPICCTAENTSLKKTNENFQPALYVGFREIMSLLTQNILPRGERLLSYLKKAFASDFSEQNPFREILVRLHSQLCKTVRAGCNLIAFLFPSNSKLNFRVRPNSNTS